MKVCACVRILQTYPFPTWCEVEAATLAIFVRDGVLSDEYIEWALVGSGSQLTFGEHYQGQRTASRDDVGLSESSCCSKGDV